jgi:hypothetical protein
VLHTWNRLKRFEAERTVIDFTAGATAAGGKLYGKSTLHHELPATASFLQPRAGAWDMGAKNVNITWTPVKNLAAYIIKIEQRTLGVNLKAILPASVTTFAVPDGFLLPGTQYQLAIGNVSNDGNISFVETTFTTAEKE